MGFMRKFKYSIQRFKKGYCDEDVWEPYIFISRTIVNILKDFKKIQVGYPANLKIEDEWKQILDEIIEGFEIILSKDSPPLTLNEEEWKKLPDDLKDNQELEDIRKINRAWELLREYFFDLWD